MSDQADDPQLADYRASIDNIDAALVHLLAERFKITKAVGRYKASADLPPADPVARGGPDRATADAGRGVRTRPGVHREVPPVRGRRSDPSPPAHRRGRVALIDRAAIDRAGSGVVAIVGSTASGKSEVAMEVARRSPGTHLVSVDSMQVYRRMDIGTAKPTAPGSSRGPAPLPRPRRTRSRLHGRPVQGGSRGGARRDRPGRRARRCWSAEPASTTGSSSTTSTCRGSGPTLRAELESIDDTASLYERLAGLDPVARGEDRTDQPAACRAGARGDRRQRPPVQLLRARRRRLPRQRRWCRSGSAGRARC